MDISETAAASALKIDRYRQLIQKMNVSKYLRSMSSLALGPRSFAHEN